MIYFLPVNLNRPLAPCYTLYFTSLVLSYVKSNETCCIWYITSSVGEINIVIPSSRAPGAPASECYR